MSTPKLSAQTLFPWLRANLGSTCLAPLTGTDARALRAAIMIIDLFNQCDASGESAVLQAFANVVRQMQPKCRHLAYHAIAHVMDWHNRPQLWRLAGLDPLPNPGRCTYEPEARQAAVPSLS